jgi:hypothetical protein
MLGTIFAFIEGVMHSLSENRWWPLLLIVGLVVAGSILVVLFN